VEAKKPARTEYSKEQLLAKARELAAEFARTYSLHDLQRTFPHQEMASLKASGLLVSAVPAAFGGVDFSFEDLIETVLTLAQGNPSIAHMYAEHAIITKDIVSRVPKKELRESLYHDILSRHAYITAAGSERHSKDVLAYETTFTPIENGNAVLVNGRKFFATGAIASDFLWVPAVMDGGAASAFVTTKSKGLTVMDDWDAMGMQATWSGSVVFENVRVPIERVVPATTDPRTLEPDQLFGPMFQTAFTAIPLGGAISAFNHAVEYVKTKTRPFPTSNVKTAAEDPFILRELGIMKSYLSGCELLVREAARFIDQVGLLREKLPREELMKLRVEAMSKVAQAKIVTTDTALRVTTDLFKVCGARATLRDENMDRFLRDIRTITVHDPYDYKAKLVGECVVRGNYSYVPFLT
jgi:alkylation response protein AidB-like acyl-CoA dehydrogenase